MRKKLMFFITLILTTYFTISYGYESITVSPKYVYNDTSKIVLQYRYKNEYYDTYNFTLSLDSSGIVFENTTVYIPYIKKDELLTLNITGYIVSYNRSYLIVVYKRYFLNGLLISGVHLVRVDRTYNLSTELEDEEIEEEEFEDVVDENITVQYNLTERVVNESVSKNITPVTLENKTQEVVVNISEEEERGITWEKNISEEMDKKENASLYNKSEVEITPDKNYIIYIVLGIISGIITGLIAVYIWSL